MLCLIYASHSSIRMLATRSIYYSSFCWIKNCSPPPRICAAYLPPSLLFLRISKRKNTHFTVSVRTAIITFPFHTRRRMQYALSWVNGIQCVASTEHLLVRVKHSAMNSPSTKHAIIVIFFSARFVAAHKFAEKKKKYLCHHRPFVRARANHRHKTEDEIKNSNAFFHLILLVRTAE